MLDELDWDSLLMRIEEGHVVPIVGQGLLQINGSSAEPTSVQRLLAGKLATYFGIPSTDLAASSTITDIFCHPLFPKEKRAKAYGFIKDFLDEAALEPPEPLRQLARIRPFSIFISTTFDNLLTRAIDQERFGGATRTKTIAYVTPANHVTGERGGIKDLPPPGNRNRDTIVYQLFGAASRAWANFAVTEADYLEFFNQLLGERTRVGELCTLLDERDLLFIGTAFPDWLSRFLLRFAKSKPLIHQRDFNEVFADETICRDDRFVAFVSHFSQPTLLYENGGAVDFVAELSRRWQARKAKYPETLPLPSVGSGSGAGADKGENRPIFISYPSEDFAAAERLYHQLTAAGAFVWFDKKPDVTDGTLLPGDDFDRKIPQQIRSCAVFVAVISRAVTINLLDDRYFRQEWTWAIDRLAYQKGLDRRFIIPVVVDNTPLDAKGIPEQFSKPQAARAPEGRLTPRDCAMIVQAAR